MPVLRMARAAQAAIGRHWALLVQGFFADGVVFPLADPGRAQALVVVWMISSRDSGPTQEAQQGRPHQH